MLIGAMMVLWAAVTTSVYTLFLGPPVILTDFFSKTGKVPYQIGRFWAGLVMRTNRVGIRVVGLERIEKRRSYVFISNHASNLDPLAVAWMLSHTLRFVEKNPWKKFPCLVGLHDGRRSYSSTGATVPRPSPESIKQFRNSKMVSAPVSLPKEPGTSAGNLTLSRKVESSLPSRLSFPLCPLPSWIAINFFPKRRCA